MTTAILALQGAFAEHGAMLDALSEPWFELRSAADADRDFDRLVLPGGESTVQGKLLREEGLLEPLACRIGAGMPVLGTCAGLILMARSVLERGPDGVETGGPGVFSTLDVTVKRNAYGRQLGSFRASAPLDGGAVVPMSFIRAPRIVDIGPSVRCLADVDGCPVAVQQGSQIAVAFHPELDGDPSIHELFLGLGDAGRG